MEIIVGLALLVRLYVFKGFHLGSLGQNVIRSPLIEGSVINEGGGGIGLFFVLVIPIRKLKRERRKEEKRRFRRR